MDKEVKALVFWGQLSPVDKKPLFICQINILETSVLADLCQQEGRQNKEQEQRHQSTF